jgi:hypothetical protein
MNKLETYFTMKDGRAIYPNVEAYRNAIAALPDGKYINKIEKLFGKRTNPQNRYYWGIVLPIVVQGLKDVGYECETVEEAHEFCKNQFIIIEGKKRKRLINKITGEIKYVKVFPTTTKLNTIQFNEYFEKIIRWGAEYLSVVIPYPNEIIEDE